jgi:hypothetical protein
MLLPGDNNSDLIELEVKTAAQPIRTPHASESPGKKGLAMLAGVGDP